MSSKRYETKRVTTVQPRIEHETIAHLAQQIWEQDGRQSGRDLDYWLKAEQELRASSAAPASATNGGGDARGRGN